MHWLGLVGLLSACGFQVPGAPAGDAAGSDAPAIDAPQTIDAPNGDPIDAPMTVDAPMVDAFVGLCDPAACGAAGGTCATSLCVIDQNSSAQVQCPAGMPCRVICDSSNSCKDGVVDCGNATACEVLCTGATSCQKGVDCGNAGSCNVLCTGDDACQGDTDAVLCRTGSCEITCNGTLGNNNTCQKSVNGTGSTACQAHCCGPACQDPTINCNVDNLCS